jgi:hypothetical protein
LKRLWALVLLLGACVVATVSTLGGASADSRIALVIGNSQYLNTPPLTNPGNDASDVAAALSSIGFKVSLRLDASKRTFDQALAQFSRDAKTADAALFYYAGHGMQFQGRNYLMPVDAELRDEVSLRYEMTTVDEVKDALGASKGVKILVLDSCRDNPLANQLVRSITVTTRDIPRVQGFARDERTNGMVIVYSTQADQVAHDGGGRNSPFSTAFLKELKEPGLEVGALFRRVESDVFDATNGMQSPELSISMVPDYYMNQSETDQSVWARVRATADPATLNAFLERFPNSFYAPDAKALLDLMQGRQGKAAAPNGAATLSRRAAADSTRPGDIDNAELLAKDRERELAARLAEAEAEKARLDEELAKANLARADAGRDAQKTENGGKDADRALPQVAVANPDASAPTVEATPSTSALESLIREQLRRLGCYTGGDLGWEAPAMKVGVAKYVRYASLAIEATTPNATLLDDMKKRRAGLCPPECSSHEALVDGRCVARTCPAGAAMSRKGQCVRRAAPKVQEAAAPRPHPAAEGPARAKGGGHCFSFNGNQYCE